MRPEGPAEASGNKKRAQQTSAPNEGFTNGDNPEFRGRNQNDGKWLDCPTSPDQCTIGRKLPPHKCMLTLHILTSNGTEKEPSTGNAAQERPPPHDGVTIMPAGLALRDAISTQGASSQARALLQSVFNISVSRYKYHRIQHNYTTCRLTEQTARLCTLLQYLSMPGSHLTLYSVKLMSRYFSASMTAFYICYG